MKIRYEWSAKDIEVGMRVSPSDRNDKVMIIGWANWLAGVSKARYFVIDPADGMVYARPTTLTKIAAHLTEYNYRPRPELRNAAIG